MTMTRRASVSSKLLSKCEHDSRAVGESKPTLHIERREATSRLQTQLSPLYVNMQVQALHSWRALDLAF